MVIMIDIMMMVDFVIVWVFEDMMVDFGIDWVIEDMMMDFFGID